jgi:hypothetical protein
LIGRQIVEEFHALMRKRSRSTVHFPRPTRRGDQSQRYPFGPVTPRTAPVASTPRLRRRLPPPALGQGRLTLVEHDDVAGRTVVVLDQS